MNRNEFLRVHWTYFLMLEEKLQGTFDYVQCHEKNFPVFSNQNTALLQLIGAEIDSFFKVYFNLEDDKGGTMATYREKAKKEEGFTTQLIKSHSFGMEWTPFVAFGEESGKSPVWWKAYTGIKHNRVTNMESGSLGNCLEALAALFLLETRYLIRLSKETGDFDTPDKSSSLFFYENYNFKTMNVGNGFTIQTF